MTEYLRLKKSNCKNCYKCIRHCPVKSIRFSGNQAHIVSDECILCGQCFVVCPQNAKEILDETETVDVLLKSGAPVVASVAPSFIAYFEGACFTTLRAALQKLGFADAEETAVGATFVKRAYDELLKKGEQDVIISTCCHSVNLLVGKHFPTLAPCLAPVVSPMVAHSADIKRRKPEAKTVFIGPCLSKKDAADGVVDAVLTFGELDEMLCAKGVAVERGTDALEQSRTRLFPTVGGILGTMDKPNPDYTYMTVDGTENCIAALNDIAAGNIHRCFIEMSACAGSCIGGPVMEKYRNSPIRHYQAATRYAGKEDFAVSQPAMDALTKRRSYIGCTQVMPGEEEIREVLRRTGKNSPADELNCGSCGYNSCREKAIAVLRGKADVDMCLPYLMEKSERFSNNILSNTPNGIIVVSESLEVQLINAAAMQMLHIRRQDEVLGEQIIRILDPLPFMNVLNNLGVVREQRDYYAEYQKYFEQTIVRDTASKTLICLMRDVTGEETERRTRETLGRQTAEIADKVVDKQMRIVQEIASLLGETAAETKIALTRLKESIPHDE